MNRQKLHSCCRLGGGSGTSHPHWTEFSFPVRLKHTSCLTIIYLFSQDPPCLQNQDKPAHLTEDSQLKNSKFTWTSYCFYFTFLQIIWLLVVRLIPVFQFVVATTSSWFLSFFCFTLTPHQLSRQNLPFPACPTVFLILTFSYTSAPWSFISPTVYISTLQHQLPTRSSIVLPFLGVPTFAPAWP